MEYKAKLRFSSRAVIITLLFFLLIAVSTVWLFYRSSGTFLPAWFAMQVCVLVLIIWVKVPRKVQISEMGIRIACVLRVVTLEKEEILHVSSLPDGKIYPLFSSLGIMGYVGYVYSSAIKQKTEIVARSLNELVYVTTVSGKVLIIGVPDSDEFLQSSADMGIKVV